jgi:hypothetical protein
VTSFHFPLQKVLEWRRKQLEVEEARFRQRLAALAAVDHARAELEAAALRAECEVRRSSRIAGSDLAALNSYRIRARADASRLAERRVGCARALAAQKAVMLEARRRCRLLERLRERREGEWKTAAGRELDQIASESYLAQWGAAGRRRL